MMVLTQVKVRHFPFKIPINYWLIGQIWSNLLKKCGSFEYVQCRRRDALFQFGLDMCLRGIEALVKGDA
jgi:hypothetical protein